MFSGGIKRDQWHEMGKINPSFYFSKINDRAIQEILSKCSGSLFSGWLQLLSVDIIYMKYAQGIHATSRMSHEHLMYPSLGFCVHWVPNICPISLSACLVEDRKKYG